MVADSDRYVKRLMRHYTSSLQGFLVPPNGPTRHQAWPATMMVAYLSPDHATGRVRCRRLLDGGYGDELNVENGGGCTASVYPDFMVRVAER